MTIQTTVLSDLVGVENIARAQAFLLLNVGVGALISIPLAGTVVFLCYKFGKCGYVCSSRYHADAREVQNVVWLVRCQGHENGSTLHEYRGRVPQKLK